jgi:FkbM family methyltransferase
VGKGSQQKEGLIIIFLSNTLIPMDANTYIEAYLRALVDVGVGYNYPGQVEDIEKAFLANYLSPIPVPVVFDIGANVGSYTRMVKELAPAAEVYSFEPHPDSFRQLALTESLGGVRAFQLAVGETEGEAELFGVADGTESALASLHKGVIENLHKRNSQGIPVQVKRLDRIVDDLNVPRIHLLKVDTEGHELSVFRSGMKILETKKVDLVQFEFNEMNVISRTFFRDFWELLRDFLLIRLTPHGGLPIHHYSPTLHEIFSLQTIVGFRRDLLGASARL